LLHQVGVFHLLKMRQLMVSREMLIFYCEKFTAYLAEVTEILTFCQVVSIITSVP